MLSDIILNKEIAYDKGGIAIKGSQCVLGRALVKGNAITAVDNMPIEYLKISKQNSNYF
jgi:hypothetical protein